MSKEKSCRVTDAYRESKNKIKMERVELMWDLIRGNKRQILVLNEGETGVQGFR